MIVPILQRLKKKKKIGNQDRPPKIQPETNKSSLYFLNFHPSVQSSQANTFSMKIIFLERLQNVTNESLRYFPGANTRYLGRRGIMHVRWMFLYCLLFFNPIFVKVPKNEAN